MVEKSQTPVRPALSSELQDDVLHDSKGLVESPGTGFSIIWVLCPVILSEIQIFQN